MRNIRMSILYYAISTTYSYDERFQKYFKFFYV